MKCKLQQKSKQKLVATRGGVFAELRQQILTHSTTALSTICRSYDREDLSPSSEVAESETGYNRRVRELDCATTVDSLVDSIGDGTGSTPPVATVDNGSGTHTIHIHIYPYTYTHTHIPIHIQVYSTHIYAYIYNDTGTHIPIHIQVY